MAAFLSSSRLHLSTTAASAAFLSSSRLHLSTTAASAASVKISGASAKSQLLKVFDPDKALSIVSSAPPSSSSSRFAVDLAVRRLARSRRFSDIDSLLQSHRDSQPQSQQHDEPFLSTLILTYGSASMLSNAHQLFEEIPQPTSTSFNALLSACVKAKKPHFVPKLFQELPAKHESICPDQVSNGILIKALCLSGKVDIALEKFREMKEKGVEASLITYTTLADAFYKKGNPEEAGKLWDEMVNNGIKPDLAAYNVRVMYPAMNGKPEEVLEVIKEIEAAGLMPDAISYNYLITCYCRNGRFGEAKDVYREFRKKGIDPNAAMFKMLVKALCRNRDFDGGLDVCRDSMKFNKIPDFSTMKVLVEGLVKGGKVEEAKEVIGVVKERFPTNLLGGWKKLEKELGLNVDEDGNEKAETA